MAVQGIGRSPSPGPMQLSLASLPRLDPVLRYAGRFFSDSRVDRPGFHQAEVAAVDEIQSLIQEATSNGEAGTIARQAGEENQAEKHFRKALALGLEATVRLARGHPAAQRQEVLGQSVRYALECGEVAEARRLLALAAATGDALETADEWRQFLDPDAWADMWLIAAVRRDPPDEKALDVLADRYWKPLFGRCLVLTLNHHKANDLAQEAWCRVLRMRHALNPGGNFPAYLTTIATNIWRDWHRSAMRAGPMAEHQMASLDAPLENSEGNPTSLADVLPDLDGLEADQKKRLKLDIYQALERLTPRLRDVLVSRFIAQETCAEIGRRYGRTEQSVSGWIRQAIHEMKGLLEESDCSPVRIKTP